MLNRPTHEVEVVYYGTTGVVVMPIVCVSGTFNADMITDVT